MNEDEIIKELAEPIIEELEKLSKEYSTKNIAMPKIKLIMDPGASPIKIDDVEIDQEMLEKLEEYLQDELEMLQGPMILN